ncbi:MAG: hypothetical protein ACOC5I_02830, partial [Gemmatimonadota bacterium]
MTRTTRLRTVVGLTFLAQLGLLLWNRSLSPVPVVAAGLILAAAAVMARRAGRPWPRVVPLAHAALVLGLVAAAATTARLEWGLRHWDSVTSSRERQLAARLDDRVMGAIQRARAAAELTAAELSGVEPVGEASAATDVLDRIRDRTEVDAVALLDGQGVAVAWSGDHRGRLPEAAYQSGRPVVFAGGSLFDYLYVTTPASGGLRSVAALLVQAGPPLRGQTGALAERVQRVTGERPVFQAPEAADVDWRFQVDGQPVLSARFPPLSQADWRSRVASLGRRAVFGLALLVLGLLSAAWLGTLPDRRGVGGMVPLAALSVTLMATPLRRTLGVERLFSPGWFVLPVPGDFVIEGVMVLLLPLAALLSTVRPGPARRQELWVRLAVGAALVGGGFAAGAGIMTASAGAPMLTSGGALWYVLQPTTVVLLTILAALMIPGGDGTLDRRRLWMWAGAGAAVSVVFAFGVAAVWRPDMPLPTPALFLWAIPFALLARAVAGYRGRGDRLFRWLVAGWLAATAVIPHLWLASQQARLYEAEADVASFGARADPFLTYLLGQFGDAVRSSVERGDRGVDLLYESWVGSGLSGEPYPVEISLWDDVLRREAHLPLGVRLEPGSPAQRELLQLVQRALATGDPANVPSEGGGVSRILVVPLETGSAVSVAVAPRASLRPTSALALFMEGEPQRTVRVDLLHASAFSPPEPFGVEWQRTAAGWRAETVVREGNDVYFAHLELRMPHPMVRLARGVLLVILDFLVLTLLWAVGRLGRGDPPVPPGGWVGWLGGFRARVTAALFVFFLIPTAVFGWAAYRALSEEVTRAARQVAERSVTQAAAVLPGAGLTETARQTGEDLLYYREGMLVNASIPEAVELGLYGAWMPPELYRRVRAGAAWGGTE